MAQDSFGPLHELDSVKDHVRQAAEAAGGLILERTMGRLEEIVREAESPIEAIFLIWWRVMADVVGIDRSLTLWPQFGFAPINGRNYRADFAIWPTNLDEITDDTPFNCVVVELDGHDYHERTKEQVIERNQRDRDFQEKGYVVLHFSGSEIHRDPDKVFLAVLDAAGRELARFKGALKARKQQG